MAASLQVMDPPEGGSPPGWRVLAELLEASRRVAPYDLPELVAAHAAALGATSVVIHLADLDQVALVPLRSGSGARGGGPALPIDSTLAGRAYQHGEVVAQPPHDEETRTILWVPLGHGADRLGVLAVAVDEEHLPWWLAPFATLVSHLVAAKSAQSDTLVTARRSVDLDLAAEIQWGLLPPLTFESDVVTIAAVLEPAYEVAGDSVDYAVEEGLARFAVFDGMGHGLRSAQLAALTVAAYRNNRRAGHGLEHTASSIDACVEEGFAGEFFTTAVLAELSLESGHLEWVTAGHPDPLLLRGGRHVKTLSSGSGLPFGLGLGSGPGYPVGREQLEPGDRVLLFTDGVVEARSPSGEQFGVERLVDLLSRTVADNLSAAESMRRVSRALVEHQTTPLSDDATMVMVEWSPRD